VWPITRDLVLEAIAAKQQFQISYWDAAILTAARQMGCQTIFSEDFDSSRDYDGLLVINPFQP
jgi:predicted nucleic acid-binding protein